MPDYPTQQAKLKKFLQEFVPSKVYDADGQAVFKYSDMLQKVANRQLKQVNIELDDLREYESTDDELIDCINQNTRRYVDLLAAVVDELVPNPTVNPEDDDVLDVLLEQRTQRQEDNDGVPAPDENALPLGLKRRFEVRIIPETDGKPQTLRAIKANHIGKLVTVRGIVTRVSDVKPYVSVVTYTCDKCGFEVYQEVTSRSFMPVPTCPVCAKANNPSKLHLQTRGSKFVKFQELKLQELPEHVPVGHVPRLMTVHLTGELTRSCTAGDMVTVAGIFLPTPYTGFRAIRAGLIADTYLDAQSVDKMKKNYGEYEMTDEVQAEIHRVSQEEDTYEKLASSIAPEIFGHDDVKKALLLQLVGGCTRNMQDGMKIRGDLHMCLMGDPGVAKSQLLKYISTVAPRGVYTTGKGSSGVGLTAAVVRDQFTQELTLEGGALVLADQGVCCIDEFDKMEESDRTAIHEVMEQQTVSIAKAGITTTLNARSAVLAAANPLYGRYNMRRSMAENINLPAALLSRFDLLFLLRDVPDRDRDTNLARHVTHVHRFSAHPDLEYTPLEPSFLRLYIAMARRTFPYVTPELCENIAATYVEMRQGEWQDDAEKNAQGENQFTTPRVLLSVLRLSQALARLRFSPVVHQSDVDESMRLIVCSKASLKEEQTKGSEKKADPVSDIYAQIRNYAQKRDVVRISRADAERLTLEVGCSTDQLEETLKTYAALGVWQISADKSSIVFAY